MTTIVSPELKAFLSCLYFEALFYRPRNSYNIESIALREIYGLSAKEIHPLIIEIMEKNPEWIDCNVLLNNSYITINGQDCNYTKIFRYQPDVLDFLEKQKAVDWNQYVVNAGTYTPLNIKINKENPELLMLMLKQLNTTTYSSVKKSSPAFGVNHVAAGAEPPRVRLGELEPLRLARDKPLEMIPKNYEYLPFDTQRVEYEYACKDHRALHLSGDGLPSKEFGEDIDRGFIQSDCSGKPSQSVAFASPTACAAPQTLQNI